jgi:AraC family transcriptional regulator, transcriptional activator of pobA
MAMEKIPVYDICRLNVDQVTADDFLIAHFSSYLDKHYEHLHSPHRHSFYHLVLFTKGSGSHQIDFTTFDVKLFQIYFMIPGQVHSWHFEGKTDGYVINFSDTFFKSFLLNPQYLDRFVFFSGVSEEGVCQVPFKVQEDIIKLFENIVAFSASSRSNDGDMIRLLLLQLFILIENSCTRPAGKSAPQQKLTTLRGFRRLIDTHYRSIRLPNDYASLLYITPNHLNALCQDLLGKTGGELIRDRILLEAKRLLTNAKMTVTEIAYDLNFKDNSYFNRFFKKNCGKTPDEFRKELSIINK